MKRLLFIILSLGLLSVNSQNLVLNSSMEILTTCPGDTGLVAGFAESWGSYRGTPSTFSQCNGLLNNVPLNHYGNALPKDGAQYVGFSAGPDVFQYLGVELQRELSPDTTYTISFWYRLASNSTSTIRGGICVGFRDFPISPTTVHPVPLPAITVDSTALDVWQRHQGTLKPFAKVRFLIIGAFKPDTLIDYDRVCPECSHKGAYIYIDAFCVSDNRFCTIPIGIRDRIEPLKIAQLNGYTIRIKNKKPNDVVSVFNISGQLVKQTRKETVDLVELPKGIYILQVDMNRAKVIRY